MTGGCCQALGYLPVWTFFLELPPVNLVSGMCLGSCPWFPQATREANTLLKCGNEILHPNQGNRNKQRKTEVGEAEGRQLTRAAGRARVSLLPGPDTSFLGGRGKEALGT